MTDEQAQRLLDVARACREAPRTNSFTMERFANPCGSPACALGNYAIRTDLQNRFSIEMSGTYKQYWLFLDGALCQYDDVAVCEWFGISEDESGELFSTLGCGGVTEEVPVQDEEDGDVEMVERDFPVTEPFEAAAYITNFVARKKAVGL